MFLAILKWKLLLLSPRDTNGQLYKTCLEKVHVMIWSDLDGIFILWHHDTMFERVKMICTAFLGPQWWIMCILSPRDIMVVREVFMMYFFLEMVYIKSRFSDHVIFIWDMICNSHFELSMIQNPVFHDPASTVPRR